MFGPSKPNNQDNNRNNNRNSNNNNNGSNGDNNDRRRSPLSYISIIIWAVVIVLLFNACFSSMQSSSYVTVPYTTFREWVEAGYVDAVQMDSSGYYFTVKSGTQPLIDYADEIGESLSDSQRSMLQTWASDETSENSVTFATAPLPVEDTELIGMLQAAGVDAEAELVTSGQYMLSTILSLVIPILIMVVAMLLIYRYMFRRMGSSGGMGGLGGVGKSNAKVYVEKKTGVTFQDVAGQDEAKESLEEIIDFLHSPQKYTEIGARLPKGALLVGPPGTGKTLLAKAVAGEANVPFFSISGSDFVEMFVGVGASRVRDLFKEASKMAPCIIFIDEIDTIGKSRDNRLGGNDEREQTLNQLLAELDGFDPSKGVIVLGATNRPEVLDKALLRPGRFDRRITIDRPNLAGRLATLQVHTRNIRLAEDVNLQKIAQATAGCVGADLANLVNEAALRAVRNGRKAVNQQDLLVSFEFVIAGSEKKGTVLTEKEKRMIAYHEVGHALVTHYQKDNTMPVSKITIVPHTQGALGYTLNLPEEEKFLMTEEDLLAEICTLLGGRSAEELVFNSKSSGAANDIERATDIARRMITMFGMSKKYGMMGLASIQNQFLDGQMGLTCAQDTAAVIDTEVSNIIEQCHTEAMQILKDHRDMLDKVAAYLLEKETITGSEMIAILEGRDPSQAEASLPGDIEPPAKSIRMTNDPVLPPSSSDSSDSQGENPQGEVTWDDN